MLAFTVLVLLLETVASDPADDGTQMSDANLEGTENGTDWSAIIAICMAGVTSLTCCIIIMFVAQHFEMKEAQRRNIERGEIYQRDQLMALSPYQPLLNAMQFKDTIVPSVYLPTVLSEETMKRLGGAHETLENYTQFLREIDHRMDDKELMSLPNSLHPNIRVRRDTQVSVTVAAQLQYLNMNKLKDFVGNTILIGQPPADRQQLDLQWHVIWEEKIGCLVWIGNVHCIGDRKMWFEAYAPVDAWKTEDAVWPIGPYKIKVLESFVQKDTEGHYIHKIELSKKTGKIVECRHIRVVHIDVWEDVHTSAFYWNSKPPFVKKIVDAIAYTHYEVFKKPKKGEPSLPNLLVNDPSGIHQSATFVILYICRQMYLHRDKVRVESVVRHVRHHRYMAWGMLTSKQLHAELKIVYRSLKMIRANVYDQEKERKASLKKENLSKTPKEQKTKKSV